MRPLTLLLTADSAPEDTGDKGFLSSLFSKDDLVTYSAAIAISLFIREYAPLHLSALKYIAGHCALS